MALRVKRFTAFLRGKKYYGFAKKKLLALKQAEIPIKTYIINGYKIVIKAITDQILIHIPPAFYVFYFERSTYTSGQYDYATYSKPIQTFSNDNYGGANTPVAKSPIDIKAFAPKNPNLVEPTFSYDFAGWVGHIAAFPGIDDSVFLPLSLPSDAYSRYIWLTWPFFVSENAVAMYGAAATTINASHAAFSTIVVHDITWGPTLCAMWYAYDMSTHSPYQFCSYSRINNINYRTYVRMQPYPNSSLPYPDGEITTYWANSRLSTIWTTCWRKNKDACAVSYVTANAGYIVPDANAGIFMFQFINFQTQKYPIPEYEGACNFAKIREAALAAHPGYSDIFQTFLNVVPMPHWLSEHHGASKVLAFPDFAHNLVLMVFPSETYHPTLLPISFSLTRGDSAAVTNSYSVPYLFRSHAFPMCVPMDVEDNLYLYWEECLYGREDTASEETSIENMFFGTPFGGQWTQFPMLPVGYDLMNFSVVTFSHAKQIIHGIVFLASPDPDAVGTYTALYDSSRSRAWSIGRKIGDARLERCTSVVSGNHKYVQDFAEATKTEYSWPYLWTESSRAGVR